MRCTCLALYRWRELLGPVAPRHPLTHAVLNALAQRPALPAHWSGAVFEVELGLAYMAAGKNNEAMKSLTAGIVAGGFDHQVTCYALLGLGQLSMMSGNVAAAKGFFLEASASACNFNDLTVVEEALRYGYSAHMVGNQLQMYEPLAAATTWAAAQGMINLQTSMLALSADNFCAIERPNEALGLLGTATVACSGTNILIGRLGAKLNFLKALASYELAEGVAGNVSLAAAMTFQAGGSLWLFHITTVDTLWQANTLTDRSAMDLFELVLRDPTPADWATDPMESLTVLVAPHLHAYEHWFELAMNRKEHERALEISDLRGVTGSCRRSTWAAGCSICSWLLEGPEAVLDQEAREQRVALEAKYTGYVQRSRRAKQLQMELRQAPLTPADEEAGKEQEAKLQELAQLSAEQEVILREIALRREPCQLLFPPIRSTKAVQEALPKGHGLLSFFSTSRHAYAFLMTNDKYGYWPIKSSPKTFVRKVQWMLQKWGNFEQNKEMKLDELADDAWKTLAKDVLDSLTTDSKAELGGDMFQELAIVPDGLLWYVPFEALQVPDGEGTTSLISKVRIRYAPTVGLAVGDPRRRRQGLNTAVALGRLFPRDEDEVSLDAYDDLSRVVPGAMAISEKLPAPSSIFGCLFDRLVVYGEIAPGNGNPYGWSPLNFNHGKQPDSALAQWLMLPWGGPDEIVLPGFRTSAEHAAKGLSPEQAANEIFLTLCGMMSTGAHTVLISRWRPGGQSSYDLVREFVQELPEMTAADAWQRSVELVSCMPVDPLMEPRIKASGQYDPPRAENPFFWAGFLLADTGSLPRGSEPEEPIEALPLVIPPIGAAAVQKPPVGEMKPGAANQENKPAAAADDPVGGGLGLRRQPGRANPRRKGAGAMPGLPSANGSATAGQPPAGIEPGGPVLDGEFGPGAKRKRNPARSERKQPAPRGKRLKERLKVEK